MAQLTVCDLAEATWAVPIFAAWLNAEWGSKRGRSLADSEAVVRSWCTSGEMPWGVAALLEDRPAGIAVLRETEASCSDLSPWLSSIFVHPAFRSRGIGSALVAAVEDRGRLLGVEAVYLQTPDRAALYGRLGWHTIDTGTDLGQTVTIMCKRLA